jgi:hypothetical protein
MRVATALAVLAYSGAASAEPVLSLEHPVVLELAGTASAVSAVDGSWPLANLVEVPLASEWSLDPGAKVRGLCPDLTPFELVGPQRRRPCPQAAPPALSPVAPLRDYLAPTVPRLLYPRATYLRRLEVIQWSSVADRRTYRVQLLDERFTSLWSARVKGTHVRYENGAALRPGGWYVVRVSAGGESSASERGDLGFRILPAGLRAEVEHAEGRLEALGGLSDAQRHFVKGLLLRRFELRGEALTEFSRAPDASFALELARTYLQVGLFERGVAELRRCLAHAASGSWQARHAQSLLSRLGASER